MKYFKTVQNDRIISISEGYGGTEITEQEYNTLLSEIREKAALVEQLYSGEITEQDIKAEWREEIVRRAEERREAEAAAEEEEATAEDLARALEEIL